MKQNRRFLPFRSEVPALCWDSAPGHQTWKPAGEQQLSAEGKSHLIFLLGQRNSTDEPEI